MKQHWSKNLLVVLTAALAGSGLSVWGDSPRLTADRVTVTTITNLAGDDLAQAITKAVQGAMPQLAGAGIVQTTAAGDQSGPRTWLGLGTSELGDDVRAQLPIDEGAGVVVSFVDEDSPATKAGIQKNDLLTKFDDQLLINPEQLGRLVRMRKEGDAVTLTGLRKGKEMQFKATLGKQEGAAEQPEVHVISFGGLQPDIKMELPPEFRKLMESAGGGATVFSTSIVIRSHSSMHSGGTGPGSGTRLHKSGGGFSSSKSSTGISARTVNGKTTITYNGEEVFSGTTSGAVSTKAVNNNGDEYAAAFDGDKVIWENKSGAAERLKN